METIKLIGGFIRHVFFKSVSSRIWIFSFFLLISCNNSEKTNSNENEISLSDSKKTADTVIAFQEEKSTPLIEQISQTSSVIESTIDGDFEGFDNEKIFKLTNGQVWQQDEYKYSYSYKYRPAVTIINSGGYYKMSVDGMSDVVKVKLLTGNIERRERNSNSADIIEGYITSDFDGYESGNIYKLDNGQIWEQTDVYIYVYVYVRPKVTIYRTGSIYKMKFDNINHAVTVRQIN